ncbi:MAG TPA: VOC family protein [Acidimicrobiales bacterium]|jgi:glyoxylase I family protein|nr:VOC family protein [Acidimicrobiales bacterium]
MRVLESTLDRRLNAIHHVALTVRDRDASAAWYSEVLGFETAFQEDDAGRKAAILRFPAGGYSVALVEHATGDGHRFDPRRPGLDHLAFGVGSHNDLDYWAARLTAAGVEHSGAIPIPTGAIVNFNDPDGIALALFWDHP